jgi:hypothetical protein
MVFRRPEVLYGLADNALPRSAVRADNGNGQGSREPAANVRAYATRAESRGVLHPPLGRYG